MSEFADYQDRVKRYFLTSTEERNHIIITILIVGLIVSFKDWEVLDGKLYPLMTLFRIFNGIVVAALVVLIHECSWRLWAIWLGFKPRSELWWPGLIAGIIIAIVSKGMLWFLAAPAVFISLHPTHRLGKFRYGLNMMAKGWIVIMGVAAVLIFAIIVKALLLYMPANFLLKKALYVALWFAAINMLPIPPLDGSRVFFMSGSPLPFVYFFSTIIGFVIFLTLPMTALWQIWLLIAGGLIVGVIGWLYYLNKFHK